MGAELDLIHLSFSFLLGLQAFFNPCGFVMLPTYVSMQLGEAEPGVRGWHNVGRGLALGLAISVGFLIVFAAVALAVLGLGGTLVAVFPWIASALGAGLIGLGTAMLLGKRIPTLFRLDARLQRKLSGQRRGGLGFYVSYGAGYGLASISCTLPLFLAVIVQGAFSRGALNGLLHFAAYGLAMTLAMLSMTVTVAVFRQAVARPLLAAMRWLQQVTPFVMMAAGAYLIYYNLVYGGLL